MYTIRGQIIDTLYRNSNCTGKQRTLPRNNRYSIYFHFTELTASFLIAFSMNTLEVMGGVMSLMLHELSTNVELQEKLRNNDKVEFDLEGIPHLNLEKMSRSTLTDSLIRSKILFLTFYYMEFCLHCDVFESREEGSLSLSLSHRVGTSSGCTEISRNKSAHSCLGQTPVTIISFTALFVNSLLNYKLFLPP